MQSQAHLSTIVHLAVPKPTLNPHFSTISQVMHSDQYQILNKWHINHMCVLFWLGILVSQALEVLDSNKSSTVEHEEFLGLNHLRFCAIIY